MLIFKKSKNWLHSVRRTGRSSRFFGRFTGRFARRPIWPTGRIIGRSDTTSAPSSRWALSKSGSFELFLCQKYIPVVLFFAYWLTIGKPLTLQSSGKQVRSHQHHKALHRCDIRKAGDKAYHDPRRIGPLAKTMQSRADIKRLTHLLDE